jgi:hypothetical protein
MTCSLVDMYSVLEEHAACVWYPPTASTVCGKKWSLKWEWRKISIKNLPYHTSPLCYLLPSLLIRRVHAGNMCILGWPIGFFRHACYRFLAFSILVTVFNLQVASLIPTGLMTHKHVEWVHVFLEDFCETAVIFLEPLYWLSACFTFKNVKFSCILLYFHVWQPLTLWEKWTFYSKIDTFHSMLLRRV